MDNPNELEQIFYFKFFFQKLRRLLRIVQIIVDLHARGARREGSASLGPSTPKTRSRT